jgi:hypothetical protein
MLVDTRTRFHLYYEALVEEKDHLEEELQMVGVSSARLWRVASLADFSSALPRTNSIIKSKSWCDIEQLLLPSRSVRRSSACETLADREISMTRPMRSLTFVLSSLIHGKSSALPKRTIWPS